MKLRLTLFSAFIAVATASLHNSLKVRGGANGVFGTPVTKKNLAMMYCSFYGLNGAISMPAPEAAKIGDTFTLTEGTPDYVVFENLGSISLGYAILVYLSVFSSKPATKTIALAAIPYAYVTYKNFLKGLTEKLSGSKFIAPLMTMFAISSISMILRGMGNTSLVAKILVLPSLVLGVVSQFDQDVGRKLAGFGSISNTGKTILMWFAAVMTEFGALALMLLSGRESIESIGWVALMEVLAMVDCIWIRKWNKGVASNGSNYVFLAVPLLTAAGILLN